MKGSLCWNMFFRKTFANKHYYIFIVFISLLLLFPSKVVSQTSNASSPPGDDDLANRGTYRFSPATSIIFVVIVVIFFVIGCFSVFARSCMEAVSPRSGLLMINGDSQRSRRAMRGLDSNVIETFPTFLYSDVKKVKRVGVLECAICLNEFKDEENLRLIPKCCHVFHPECIDTWLVSRSTCPVCRADLVPVPGETGTNNNNCNISSLGLEEDATAHPAWLDGDRGQVRETNDTNIELDSGLQKKKFDGKYPRSHSTGHSLIKPRTDNNERFTLRLSQDLQKKLIKPELRRAKSTIVFPRASSSKKGYRSSSVGPGLPIHNVYEQFNHEVRQDRWVFTRVPPFFTRSRSLQTPITGGDIENNYTVASGSSSRPVKSPFEWLFGGSSRKDDEAGERSFVRLMGNDKV